MRSRLGVLLAVAVLALTACGGGGGAGGRAADPTASPSGSPSTSSATTPGAAGSGDTRQYVALGDSFTSAPLVPETDPADPCLRSSMNYPALVAQAVPGLELTDVSCAGADSTALVGVQTIGSDLVPAQFDALSDDTDLVTVGMGGNDFGLLGSLIADCASSSSVDPQGQPCTDAALGGQKQDLTKVLPKLEERITAVLAGVADRAPGAEVVLVGYPRLLPATGTCPQLPVAAGDYDYVRSLDRGLNDALARAAQASGVTYVDVFAASEGHDICSAQPWVNGKDTIPGRALAFHPFAEGQQAVADLVVDAIG